MARKRHNKKKPYPVSIVGERATPERRKQLGGVMSEVIELEEDGRSLGRVKRDRVRIECVLDYYFNTNRLDDRQTKAGEKYRELFNRVTFGHHYKVLCNPFLIDPGQADPEARILAHMDCIRQLREADELLSSEQYAVVRDVCGYNERAVTFARKKTLRRALDILAKLWGYV